jgi:hypothetical protein
MGTKLRALSDEPEELTRSKALAGALLNRLPPFRYLQLKATWRSGYAAVCKTVYPGSIPGVASKQINDLIREGVASIRHPATAPD